MHSPTPRWDRFSEWMRHQVHCSGVVWTPPPLGFGKWRYFLPSLKLPLFGWMCCHNDDDSLCVLLRPLNPPPSGFGTWRRHVLFPKSKPPLFESPFEFFVFMFWKYYFVYSILFVYFIFIYLCVRFFWIIFESSKSNDSIRWCVAQKWPPGSGSGSGSSST